MKKNLKISLLSIALFNLIWINCNAQDTTANISNEKIGYRTHSLYFGTIASIPVGGLKDYVPVGIGLKWGSIFTFSKKGFSNGLLNVGLKAEWMNIETNVPYGKLDDDNFQYSLAFAQNYGPQFTIHPSKSLFIDFFYCPGWGFRMFPNIDDNDYYYGYPYYYNDDIDPDVPHLHFSQSVGFSLRYYSLYASVNLQKLSNNGYENGAFISKQNTVEITIGLVGWQNKK